MFRTIWLLLLLVIYAEAAVAQTPKFGKAGGIGSATSTYPTGGGEPQGGTYSINGTTGIATLGGIVLPAQSTGSVLAAPATTSGTPTFRTITSNDLLSAGAAIKAASNAALLALSTAQASAVVRMGYYGSGDSASVIYYPSASACSLNSGNGDGGSQVKSADNKCWLASFPAGAIDVQAFGAKCDGVTDDAAAINAALTFAGTLKASRVLTPNDGSCAIGSTLVVPARVVLSGPGISNGGSLVAKATNLTMVNLSGAFSGVENMMINAGAAGTNTAGYAVTTAFTQSPTVRNLLITAPFVGVDLNGGSPIMDNVTVNNLPSGGIGWMVGRLSTLSATTDPRITNSTVGGASTGAAYGQVIYDAGGLFELNNDLIFANVGTYIAPGANQQVIWAFFANSALGDTNGSYGILIDALTSTSMVKGLQCTGCWSASAQSASIGSNIVIQNSGGGTIDGIHFTGLRNYTSAKTLAYLTGGTNISFVDSQFCGAASGQTNITLTSGVSGVRFTGGHNGAACDGNTGGGSTGITLGGGNTNISVVGMDFSGLSTPVSGSPTGDSAAASNSGLGVISNVATASTITLPGIYENYALTGTASVSTINGAWTNRSVRLVTTGGAVSFTTGGNICNAITSTQNVPVIAVYLASCWYLK